MRFINSEKDTTLFCSHCNKDTKFKKQQFIANYPKYLIVQVTNFALNGWVPKKLHCNISLTDADNIGLDAIVAKELPENTVSLS